MDELDMLKISLLLVLGIGWYGPEVRKQDRPMKPDFLRDRSRLPLVQEGH